MKKSASKQKPAASRRGGGAQRDAKATGSRATRSGKGGDPMREDFPGYPHHPSRTSQGRTIHNGSAGAFDATEHSHDEEDEDQDSDDFAMDR